MSEDVIFLVDSQSFYASVEKADNPALKKLPVVVAGDPERRSGIILAACPLAKKYGIKTAEPLWQAQQKCPHVTVVQPRMERYIEVSLQITEILEQITDLVEPFSIDEQFLNITGSQSLFGDPLTIAEKIQSTIMERTGVYGRVGIGPNKILAKMACDNFAKKNEKGIFWLTKNNMQKYMWPLPIRNLFGVGSRMERHFTRLGIKTIGDLAQYPLEVLKKRWGINGHVLWLSANGIDISPVTPETFNKQKSIGHFLTLPRDYYNLNELRIPLSELTEEVCMRARQSKVMGETVSVGCRGADFDFPTGFHRQAKLSEPTNITDEVFQTAWDIFKKHWDRQPVRALGVSLSDLTSDDAIQLSLFNDREKKFKLGYVIDEIKGKYGTTAIIRASSLMSAGQALDRAGKIGGHYK